MPEINLKIQISKTLFLMALLISFCNLSAQDRTINTGTLTGNFQVNSQYYAQDSAIGTPEYPQKVGTNSFMYLQYSRGKFGAGMRYEAYMPALQGFTRNQGAGFAHRYLEYKSDMFDIRVGNFYEQFGSGMSLRTYEAWGLGFDNSIDGIRAKIRPIRGIEIKGIIGKQRNAFSPGLTDLSAGIIRGADLELGLNDIIPGMDTVKTRLRLGGSFVSRYEKDEDPIQILPENVATYGGRAQLNYAGFSIFGEYVHKVNDPSSINSLIYKPGNGLLVQTSYSMKGLGISLAMKRIDNLDFRSQRSATFNNLTINYLPPQTKQHTYRLPTLFPWATQTLGEFGVQLEVLYRIPKKTKLGGPYGTNLTFNFSRVHGLKKTPAEDPEMGYTSEIFDVGDRYFQDINLEISRKFSKKFKAALTYYYFTYEKSLFKQLTGLVSSTDVQAHVAILEGNYRLSKKHSLRGEFQHLYTKQEFGSWAMLLLEYNVSPHWFVAVFDEWNYGNANVDKQLHYFTVNAGYTLNNFRVILGYGRQRSGVLCVGGVCRVVPASNGITLSLTGSF